MRLFARREPVEDRNLTRESLPPVLAPAIAAAESVNGRTALQLADVYACVRALCDAAVLCPMRFWRDTESGRQVLTGGRGVNLLRAPAPAVTQSALVAALVQNMCTFGESFLGLVRDGDGQIIQLESLAAERMVVRLVKGEPLYSYYSPLDGVFDGLTVHDVIHIVGMRSPDGLRGASPIGLCKEALGLNASLTTAASSLWANGAVPAGILSVPAGPTGQDAIGSLADAWSARHQGPEARGRVAVISGDVKWQSVTMPLSDAEFVAQRKLSTAEIARIMRVPVSVIGGSSGDSVTYRNAVGEAEILVKFGLAPMLRLIEDAISGNTDLLPGATSGISFDVDSVLLRSDPATRAAISVQLVAAGIMTIEEAREREGWGPLPPGTAAPNLAAESIGEGLAKAGLSRGQSEGA